MPALSGLQGAMPRTVETLRRPEYARISAVALFPLTKRCVVADKGRNSYFFTVFDDFLFKLPWEWNNG